MAAVIPAKLSKVIVAVVAITNHPGEAAHGGPAITTEVTVKTHIHQPFISNKLATTRVSPRIPLSFSIVRLTFKGIKYNGVKTLTGKRNSTKLPRIILQLIEAFQIPSIPCKLTCPWFHVVLYIHLFGKLSKHSGTCFWLIAFEQLGCAW